MKEYVLLITNKWTDHKYVHPVLYTIKEAKKEREIQTTKNVVIDIFKITPLK